MLDFQKSSFQLSMKESSSIRVTTGGKDSLEAWDSQCSSLDSTARSGSGSPVAACECSGASALRWHHKMETGMTASLDVWPSAGFSSGVLKWPSHATGDRGHGKTTGGLGNHSVLGVCLWQKIIHQRVFTLLNRTLRLYKGHLLPHNPMFCCLRLKKKKKGESSLFTCNPTREELKKCPVRTFVTCSHLMKTWLGRNKAEYFHLSKPSDND